MVNKRFWTLEDLNEEERKSAIRAGAEKGEEYWGDPGDPRNDIFVCPYCSEKVTVLEECEHVVFIFDGINVEYLELCPGLKKEMSARLKSRGIETKEPVHPKNHRIDEKGYEIPSLSDLMPEIEIQEYSFGWPGNWNWYIGFSDDEKYLFPSSSINIIGSDNGNKGP
jgi:hypothetical protein